MANSRVLIVLFPTNKILAVTEIIIEKHCDKVLLRSHMLTVLSPLKHTKIFLPQISRAVYNGM